MKSIQVIKEQIISLSYARPTVKEGGSTESFYTWRNLMDDYQRKLKNIKLEISKANKR